MESKAYLNTKIAGFSYYDGAEVFNNLTLGAQLTLRRDMENRYDPEAVAVYFGENKLGFLPSTVNSDISKFLELGYEKIFETRINRISPTDHCENQIGIIIKIVPAV